jgi:hypothetical protein
MVNAITNSWVRIRVKQGSQLKFRPNPRGAGVRRSQKLAAIGELNS